MRYIFGDWLKQLDKEINEKFLSKVILLLYLDNIDIEHLWINLWIWTSFVNAPSDDSSEENSCQYCLR